MAQRQLLVPHHILVLQLATAHAGYSLWGLRVAFSPLLATNILMLATSMDQRRHQALLRPLGQPQVILLVVYLLLDAHVGFPPFATNTLMPVTQTDPPRQQVLHHIMAPLPQMAHVASTSKEEQ